LYELLLVETTSPASPKAKARIMQICLMVVAGLAPMLCLWRVSRETAHVLITAALRRHHDPQRNGALPKRRWHHYHTKSSRQAKYIFSSDLRISRSNSKRHHNKLERERRRYVCVPGRRRQCEVGPGEVRAASSVRWAMGCDERAASPRRKYFRRVEKKPGKKLYPSSQMEENDHNLWGLYFLTMRG
jgi:hypothetical protein